MHIAKPKLQSRASEAVYCLGTMSYESVALLKAKPNSLALSRVRISREAVAFAPDRFRNCLRIEYV